MLVWNIYTVPAGGEQWPGNQSPHSLPAGLGPPVNDFVQLVRCWSGTHPTQLRCGRMGNDKNCGDSDAIINHVYDLSQGRSVFAFSQTDGLFFFFDPTKFIKLGFFPDKPLYSQLQFARTFKFDNSKIHAHPPKPNNFLFFIT